MNTSLKYGFWLLFSAWLPAASGQNLCGSDNFNDNVPDGTKWGADHSSGTAAGALAETNGRLDFSSSTTEYTYRGRPWIKNSGSYIADWAVQLDTVVPTDSGPGNFVGFGLEVGTPAKAGTSVGIEHDNDRQSPEFYSYIRLPESEQPISTTSENATNLGAVRISFNAASKILTTQYDADGPLNGYQWTSLASYGISSLGGGTYNFDWGMTNSDTFSILAFGVSSGVVAAVGQTYGDNFVATSPPPPQLQSTVVFTGPKAGTITVPSIVGKTYRLRRSENLEGTGNMVLQQSGTGANLTFPFDDSASSIRKAFFYVEESN